MVTNDFETRYEWLRPAQLIERKKECPLVIMPLGPLEYHGPHLPLGTDALNATAVAHACCRKLGKGVVMPTLFAGTERERDPQLVEALGFKPGSYIVGMDFPSRLWNSHYFPEEVFALMVAAELDILVGQGYHDLFIVNGHGATNHGEVLRRLCVVYRNTRGVRIDFCLSYPQDIFDAGLGGHADIVETSMLAHYRPESVDLDTLPPQEIPIHYQDFSIVDGPGFSPHYDRDHVVRTDPREATAERGKAWFDQVVNETVTKIENFLKQG